MKSHGTWEITLKCNLLIINIKGNFNVEGVVELHNDIRKVVLDKKLTSWNRLEIYEKNTLATPDAIIAIKKQLIRCKPFGCEYVGVICRESVQVYIIKQLEIENLIIFDSLIEAENYFLNANELNKSDCLVSKEVVQY